MIPSDVQLYDGIRVILDNYGAEDDFLDLSSEWPNFKLYHGKLIQDRMSNVLSMEWVFVADLYDEDFHEAGGLTPEGHGWYVSKPYMWCSLEGPYQKPERKKNGFSKFISRISGKI